MLRVGVRESPPFVVRAEDGGFHGIAVELWQDVADRMGLRYAFEEYDELGELLRDVERHDLDLAVGALSNTPERERRLDFTQPYYHTGLGIAVRADRRSSYLRILGSFFSWEFLAAVSSLFLVLLGAGILVWFFERRANPEHFGGDPASGIGAGIWWAAVTMTTVGYGDKAPRTLGGRALALVWMFAGIVSISGFTAAFTTALALGTLESSIRGPRDLEGVLVGTVPGSSSEEYLRRAGIPFLRFDDVAEALRAVDRGEIPAVVYDAPILEYLKGTETQNRLRVLPELIGTESYGFALPSASELREPLNRALLEELEDPAWEALVERYLGEDGG